MKPFLEAIDERVLVSDGAMGTMLYAKGFFINRCFDALNLMDADRVREVHDAYVRAGADLIETNTFGANRIKLRAFGLADRLAEINAEGARIARSAAGTQAYVAGAIGPLGIRIEPWGRTGTDEAEGYFREQAQGLLEGGVDLFMLETFRDRAWPEVQRAAAVGLTPPQVLVLASIVEREAAVPEERPVLAGVFLNRLRINMPLAADPTVQYVLVPPGAPTPPVDGYWKRDLTLQDLRIPSLYNTYITAGLPPSPIANPGLGSIRGVVAPTASDFLFFVARPDRSHALAVTFEEHLANVRRYQP